MRFKSTLLPTPRFTRLLSSLSPLSPIAWLQLSTTHVRLTIIPSTGSQVWAVLSPSDLFDADYAIESAHALNTINLEVALAPLQRALKSAQHATHANLRLTKKEGQPVLSCTITAPGPLGASARGGGGLGFGPHDGDGVERTGTSRDTVVTQDVPVRVVPPAAVEDIHAPRMREPEVHVFLPPLAQLKAVSERFTRLALASAAPGKTTSAGATAAGFANSAAKEPKLELAANMHGELRLGVRTEGVSVESRWEGLVHPDLDPESVGGEEAVRAHPSTRMRGISGEEGWASVRVEAKDWGRVLGIGRMGGRVVACKWFLISRVCRKCLGMRIHSGV